jgi:hypothetical protein
MQHTMCIYPHPYQALDPSIRYNKQEDIRNMGFLQYYGSTNLSFNDGCTVVHDFLAFFKVPVLEQRVVSESVTELYGSADPDMNQNYNDP